MTRVGSKKSGPLSSLRRVWAARGGQAYTHNGAGEEKRTRRRQGGSSSGVGGRGRCAAGGVRDRAGIGAGGRKGGRVPGSPPGAAAAAVVEVSQGERM